MATFEQEYKRKQADRLATSRMSPADLVRENALREQRALGASGSESVTPLNTRSMPADEFQGIGQWTPKVQASEVEQPQNALSGYPGLKSFSFKDPGHQVSEAERQNSAFGNGKGTDLGMMDYGPQNVGGDNWVNALNANLDDDFVQKSNAESVMRAEQDEFSRQAQIVNALKQQAAEQKMAIEMQEQNDLSRFGPPQLRVEMAKIENRRRLAERLGSMIQNIQQQAQGALDRLYADGVDPNDPAIKTMADEIRREALRQESLALQTIGFEGGDLKIDADKMIGAPAA